MRIVLIDTHNEPQPKKLLLTEWNSHGIFFREPFHFREPKFFAFLRRFHTLEPKLGDLEIQ